MISPEEEGRKSFLEGKTIEACPYKGKSEKIEWKLGYTKEEYDKLQEEQASLLESMGFYSEPHTGLEDIIRKVQQKIDEYDQLRTRSIS